MPRLVITSTNTEGLVVVEIQRLSHPDEQSRVEFITTRAFETDNPTLIVDQLVDHLKMYP